MNSQRLIPGLALLISSFPPLTAAQEPSFQADVEVVHILATVRDKEGRLVQDLTRDDFVLEEEGRLQEIEFFSEQSDLPLTLGLLVDSSMSQRRFLEEERQASYQFFEQILEREEDRAFVLSFDVDVELLEDLVLAAVSEAMTKSQQLAAERLEGLTGGLKIPGLT